MDMDINVIDLVLGASLLYGLINGLYKGFFIEVASLLGLICGVYGAIHFSHFATSLIKQKVEWDEQYINIVAFAITFIFIVFVVSLVGKTLTKLANFIALGVLNKIFGAVFGVLKIGLIYTNPLFSVKLEPKKGWLAIRNYTMVIKHLLCIY